MSITGDLLESNTSSKDGLSFSKRAVGGRQEERNSFGFTKMVTKVVGRRKDRGEASRSAGREGMPLVLMIFDGDN